MKEPVIVRAEAETDLAEAYQCMSNKFVIWAGNFSCAWML